MSTGRPLLAMNADIPVMIGDRTIGYVKRQERPTMPNLTGAALLSGVDIPEGSVFWDVREALKRHGISMVGGEIEAMTLTREGGGLRHTGKVDIRLHCYFAGSEPDEEPEPVKVKAMPYARQRKYYDYGFANRGGCGEARRYNWKLPDWDEYGGNW